MDKKKNKLWLLKHEYIYGIGPTISKRVKTMVIIAPTELSAREFAHGYSGQLEWLDQELSTCESADQLAASNIMGATLHYSDESYTMDDEDLKAAGIILDD